MRKFWKWLGISLLSLVLLLIGAVALVLGTPLKNRLIAHFTKDSINAEVSVGRIRIKPFTLPDLYISIEDASLRRNYGKADTLAGFSLFEARINIPAALKGRYCVNDALLDSLSLDWRACDSLLFIRKEAPEEVEVIEKEPLRLPEFSVGFRLKHAEVSFLDYVQNARIGLAVKAANSASGQMSFELDSLDVRANKSRISVQADAHDLLGGKPELGICADAEVSLRHWAHLLPSSIAARGLVRLSAEGAMSPEGADLLAIVSGDKVELSLPQGRTTLNDVRIEAGARQGEEKLQKSRRRATRRIQPEYLKEEDFRKSDINIELDSTITSLIKAWNPHAQIHIGEGSLIETPLLPLENRLEGFDASLDVNSLEITQLKLVSGASDIALQGSLKGLEKLLTGKGRSFFDIKLKSRSKCINLNQIMLALDLGSKAELADTASLDAHIEKVAVSDTVQTAQMKLFVLPANVKADVNIKADRLLYSNIDASKLSARLQLARRTALLSDVGAMTDMGEIRADAFYSTVSKQNIGAGFDVGFSNVSAEKVIAFIPQVDSLVPLLKTFKGNVDCAIAATTKLDTCFTPLPATFKGAFSIRGSELSLNQEGQFKKIARLLMFRDRKKGLIKSLEINGIVQNQELTLFPFELALDRYSLCLGGVQNMEGPFDYKVSLMRSPLLIPFGVNLKGKDFKHPKFKLMRSQYKAGKVPSFQAEVDEMLTLQNKAIRQSISSGGVKAYESGNRIFDMLSARKSEIDGMSSVELLSEEEQACLKEADSSGMKVKNTAPTKDKAKVMAKNQLIRKKI